MSEGIQPATTRWLHNAKLERLGVYVPLLLAPISLILLIGIARYLIAWPYDGVEWTSSTGVIEQVDPLGPAAGLLQPGDVVTGVNGRTLAHATQLYAGQHAGDWVTFTVRRAGAEQTASFRLTGASWRVVLDRLEPLFIGLLFWALGFVVLAFKPLDGTARLFFAFNQVSGAALGLGALSATGVTWASQLFSVFLWFLGPLTIHLHLQFPRPLAVRRWNLLLLAIYGLAVVGGALDVLQRYGRAPFIPSYLAQAASSIYLMANFFAAVALLAYTYSSSPSTLVRQQIRLLALGAAVALVGTSAFLLLPEILIRQALIPTDWAFLFLLAIPFAYGYCLLRYRLIAIERKLSRNLVYLFLVLLLTMLYTLSDMGLKYLLPPSIWQAQWFNMLFILFVALTFIPLRDQLQAIVDWVVYGGWYNYRTAVQKISQTVDGITDTGELTKQLLLCLPATLRLECNCLLLRDRDGSFTVQGVYPSCRACPAGSFSLEASSSVTDWLQREQQPIPSKVLARQLEHMSAEEQTFLSRAHACLWVPLVEGNELFGILLLGRKQSEDLFDDEDFQILDTVRRQISVTIQNATLLLDLSGRAAEIEQLHQQSIRIREEERKGLARELHDQIIQALVGLSYDLSALQAGGGRPGNGQAEKAQQQIREIIADLRRVCSELRPPALDSLGLVPAIRSRLREFEAQSAGQVQFVVDGQEEMPLPEEATVCLYHVLAEALLNVQKHAHATRVTVNLVLRPAEARLSVRDDGCGFAPPPQLSQLMSKGHFGLVGARERLELIGGKLLLRSTLGHGTLLEASLPLCFPAEARK